MRTFLSLAALLLSAGAASAQTSYPMITHVSPVAVQRGKTSTVVVSGQMNFAGCYKALFEGEGISAKVVQPKKEPAVVRSVTLELTVKADAAPGVREFRLASNLGLSSVGQLVVCDEPVVEEKGDNNTREKANPIPVPSVVCGCIEALEDVDFFKFKAKAGQTFTFEAICARIQDRIHDLQKHADPIITLFDDAGRELAANDDFYFADSLLTFTFKKDGDYFIQIRDSKYDGDPRWVYALLVTDRPYASHVYPMAAKAGEEVTLHPVGSAGLTAPRLKVTAPKTTGLQEIVLDAGNGKTNPVPLYVSDLVQVNEVEPNDTLATATRIAIPCGVNGRIDKARDLDHFVFAAKKGQAIRFEVKARRFGTQFRSALDSVLDVLNKKGDVLATNDDTNGKDSLIVFVPPADGEYVLRIRDLNSKGGPTFVYHVEADHARPDFSLKCDGDKAMIGPGSRTAWFVQLTRSGGFEGPVKIDVNGLPKGVTVNPLTIKEGQTQGLLVLSASADATKEAANVSLTGTATLKVNGKDEAVTRSVTPSQEIYFPGGGRGLFDVGLQTVGITDPSDILKVEVTPQKIRLKPGEEVRLDVTIHRRADYNKGISLDIMLQHLGSVFANPLPPGVTVVAGKSKTLLGTGSKGHIVLKAAPGTAPIEDVPICVLAHVSINFVVKVSYSSPALLLSVGK
jgi:hypothetical protein